MAILTHHERHCLIEVRHFEYEGSQDIESLAVPSVLVEPGIGQQDMLQDSVLLLAAETSITGSVQVLLCEEGGREGGRVGGRGGREGGREEGREGEREGGRERRRG